MRKSLLLFAIAALGTAGAYAQMTGGGSGGSSPKVAVAKKDASKWGALVIGLSSPMGKFGTTDASLPFEEAVGANSGFYLGYDGANYFPNAVAGPVKIGFSSAVNVSLNTVNWDAWGIGEGEYTPFIFTGIKLGALGTYEIIDGLEADAFFRLGLNAGVGAMGYWSGNSASSYVDLYTDTPAFGFGTEFGFNVRYEFLLATLRFNPGKLTYTYMIDTDESFDEVEYKLPISTVQLGIGFVLNKK